MIYRLTKQNRRIENWFRTALLSAVMLVETTVAGAFLNDSQIKGEKRIIEQVVAIEGGKKTETKIKALTTHGGLVAFIGRSAEDQEKRQSIVSDIPFIRIGAECDPAPEDVIGKMQVGMKTDGERERYDDKTLIRYASFIYSKAFGCNKLPTNTKISILEEDAFEEVKRRLDHKTFAQAFYDRNLDWIFEKRSNDDYRQLSVTFHEIGHAVDAVVTPKPSSEFTSEAMQLYLDLISCKTLLEFDITNRTNITGEVYLNGDGRIAFISTNMCKGIIERIAGSQIAFVGVQSFGIGATHNLGVLQFLFRIAETEEVGYAMEQTIHTQNRIMTDRTIERVEKMSGRGFRQVVAKTIEVIERMLKGQTNGLTKPKISYIEVDECVNATFDTVTVMGDRKKNFARLRKTARKKLEDLVKSGEFDHPDMVIRFMRLANNADTPTTACPFEIGIDRSK